MESRQVRHKDEKARLIFPAVTAPPSLITPLLPFYLLPCSQSPWLHLFLFPFLPVPWGRTEKTRRPACLLVHLLQERDCWFTSRALQSVQPNHAVLCAVKCNSLSHDTQGPLKKLKLGFLRSAETERKTLKREVGGHLTATIADSTGRVWQQINSHC